MQRLAKQMVKALLRKTGYEIRRSRISRKSLNLQTQGNADLYLEYTSPWPIYSPWVVPEFQANYRTVANFTAGNADRAYALLGLAGHAKYLNGEFAEAGVYRGGSALLLCRCLEDTPKKLFLFDSFQGLPTPDRNRDPHFEEGQYAASLESVRERLQAYEGRTEFRAGWIPDSFLGLEDRRYAFAHIDLDLYRPTLDACQYFYPRMTAGGIMLFDEYGFPSAYGEKLAVDEFFAGRAERPIALITGQAFAIKL